jgi:hypothetical protein
VYLGNELRAQLADVALAQRDETKVRALLEEAFASSNELGAPCLLGWLITFLAQIALQRGEGFHARILLEESMKLHQQMNDQHGMAHTYTLRGTRSEDYAPSCMRLRLHVRCLFG